MSYDNNVSLQKAQEIVKSYDGSQLSARERKDLSWSTSIIERSDVIPEHIQDKLTQAKEGILKHDIAKLKENLKKINKATEENKKFYVYKRGDEIKVKVLSSQASKLEKMRFKTKKSRNHDLKLIGDLIANGKKLAEKDAEIAPLLLSLHNFVLKEKVHLENNFFKKNKDIQTFQSLNKALNALQPLKPVQIDWEQATSILATRGRTSYEEFSKKEKVDTLIGLSIASTVENRLASRITPRDNYFGKGGSAIMATMLEKDLIEKALEENTFSEDEKATLEQYLSDINRSLDLNFMLYYNGSIEATNRDRGIIARAAWQKALDLKENEAIHLDLGFPGHAMRAGFRKVDDQMIIRLYDTSGGLEILKGGNPIKGLFHTLTGQKQFVALELKVPVETFEEKGVEYLQNLLFLDSSSQGKPKAELAGYRDFMRTFTSIAPSYELVVKKKPQTTHNCFAQRVLPSELDQLGHDLYKRVRKASLQEIYVQLIDEYKESLVDQYRRAGYSEEDALNRIENRIKVLEEENPVLSSKELEKTRDYLGKMASAPSSDQDWFYCLRILRHKIAK